MSLDATIDSGWLDDHYNNAHIPKYTYLAIISLFVITLLVTYNYMKYLKFLNALKNIGKFLNALMRLSDFYDILSLIGHNMKLNLLEHENELSWEYLWRNWKKILLSFTVHLKKNYVLRRPNYPR